MPRYKNPTSLKIWVLDSWLEWVSKPAPCSDTLIYILTGETTGWAHGSCCLHGQRCEAYRCPDQILNEEAATGTHQEGLGITAFAYAVPRALWWCLGFGGNKRKTVWRLYVLQQKPDTDSWLQAAVTPQWKTTLTWLSWCEWTRGLQVSLCSSLPFTNTSVVEGKLSTHYNLAWKHLRTQLFFSEKNI